MTRGRANLEHLAFQRQLQGWHLTLRASQPEEVDPGCLEQRAFELLGHLQVAHMAMV